MQCSFILISDYRHSNADQPVKNIPQYSPQMKLPSLDLGLTMTKYNTAHIRGRHGVVDYNNFPPSTAWTLPKRGPGTDNYTNYPNYNRTVQGSLNLPTGNIIVSQDPSTKQGEFSQETLRISPIDPRAEGQFKSSTPSNKENVINLSSKLLSPVKSTMSNEELYAVIHKSKKKLNIKDSIERSNSPALSSISLSPVNSESNLNVKGISKPETGYLGDPRSRSSWSVPSDRQNAPLSSLDYSSRPQKSTCADRLGPIPQTSRHDFKKLLLQHSVKLNTLAPQTKHKLSAVEQLKLSKEKPLPVPPQSNVSQINILDLSGSPKTYTHRKLIKPVNNQPGSLVRTSNLIKEHKTAPKIMLSPKSQWRFSSPRSDVLSSPIPEANNEDDTSIISSGEKVSPVDRRSGTVAINVNQRFGARRNLIPITENPLDSDSEVKEPELFCVGANTSPGLSRAEMLQAKRAEFFNSPPKSTPPALTSFKVPSPTASNSSRDRSSPKKEITTENTLETAL